jgi:hypothetical protein
MRHKLIADMLREEIVQLEEQVYRDGLLELLTEHFNKLDKPLIDQMFDRFSVADIALFKIAAGQCHVASWQRALVGAMYYPEYFSADEIIYHFFVHRGVKPAIENLADINESLETYDKRYTGIDRYYFIQSHLSAEKVNSFNSLTHNRFNGYEIERILTDTHKWLKNKNPHDRGVFVNKYNYHKFSTHQVIVLISRNIGPLIANKSPRVFLNNKIKGFGEFIGHWKRMLI